MSDSFFGNPSKNGKIRLLPLEPGGGAGTPRAGYHFATIAQHNYIVQHSYIFDLDEV